MRRDNRGRITARATLALAIVAAAAGPPPSTAAPQGAPLVIDLGGGESIAFERIPAGVFVQGSLPEEAGRGEDESRREVQVARGFYIGRTQVTRGQFARFVAETRYRTEAERGGQALGYVGKSRPLAARKEFSWRNPGFPQNDDHPVVMVTFEDAHQFARWLSKKSGKALDLPTEARWEYACRAGTTTPYPRGDSNVDTIAWTRENAGDGTRRVGRRAENSWKLLDMCGNVYEWCLDAPGPYEPGPITDPLRLPDGPDAPERVIRGGSWHREARFARSAARDHELARRARADLGFRLVASLDPVPASDPQPPTPPPATSTSPARAAAPEPTPTTTTAAMSTSGSAFWSGVALLSVGLAALGFVIARIVRTARRPSA